MDYVALAQVALDLVKANGRQVTFRQLTDTPADANKPWRGATDPTTGATAAVWAVAVPPSSATSLGMSTSDNDLVKRSTQILIVAPGPTLPDDLADFEEVIDGTVTYRITGTETLRPGDTTLLYFVGIAQ